MDPISTFAALLFAALQAEPVTCERAFPDAVATVCAKPSAGWSKTRRRFERFAGEHLTTWYGPHAPWRREPGRKAVRLFADGVPYELLWISEDTSLALVEGHPCFDAETLARLGAGIVGHDGVEAPVAVKRNIPRYPEEARVLRESGAVWVDALVAADGRIVDLCVVGSTSSLFEGSALRWAADLQLEPATLDGNAVAVIHPLYVTWELQ